ncbi:hypothetical protein [Streptomyces genisteinicus]|uniref:Uncharacterized protein n=1 Tax=Streptomyces genisteinicus TaxID=2768068 RepID=A0A7H0HZB4_9ACTN|nr:hypothetical protein [Streptomyces genisteinicus]QNP65880.1 hypothetical protein IAG43_25090 [Streptomyces genisteinicus]
MEQRIDPNTKPEFAASTNPSFVPGLTGVSPSGAAPAGAPGKEEPEDSAPAAADGTRADDDTAADSDTGTGAADGPAAKTGADADARDEAAEDVDGDVADAVPSASGTAGDDDGPAFEASDRRGSITAGRDGIVFRLDDQEADFRWDEIGAVEITPARFGRRFTVTVHTAANRWFNADVEADSRARLKEWTAGLDAVLDAYFEE